MKAEKNIVKVLQKLRMWNWKEHKTLIVLWVVIGIYGALTAEDLVDLVWGLIVMVLIIFPLSYHVANHWREHNLAVGFVMAYYFWFVSRNPIRGVAEFVGGLVGALLLLSFYIAITSKKKKNSKSEVGEKVK